MSMHPFDPTPYLPTWAQAMPRPMRQAIYTLEQIMLRAPGVDVHLAALHRPGTPTQQREMLGTISSTGDTTPDDLLEMLRQARGANASPRSPANILFRPDPSSLHPWLFLDDLPTPRALALTAKISGLVIETSQGNAQIRLLADRTMSQAERGHAQKTLQSRLGGDPGSTSGEKWGRLPGFTNRKPGKTGQWTNLISDTTGIRPPISADRLLSLSLAPQGGACAPAFAFTSPARDRPKAGALAGASPVDPHPRTKADFAHAALSKPLPAASEQAGGWRQEFADTCQALRAGLSGDEITQALADRALQRGKRRTQADAEQYARQTVQRALQAVGAPS